MSYPALTDDILQETVDLVAIHGSELQAAAAIGVSRPTFCHRHRTAKTKGFKPKVSPVLPDAPVAAELPPPDIDFDERLRLMKSRNALRIAHKRAQAWQQVTIPIDGPYGLCFFGDPHLDDPFCDLDLLERHAAICRDTQGLYGVNGGDSLNNWIGNLKKLYADQPATAEEGWELADWFMNRLGIRWALWLLGNHDVWETGFRIFEKMNVQRIVMRDWDARIRLVSRDGECRLWARHDFKGTSIYNELHGLKRAAMFSGSADIYAAFHRHTWGTAGGETEEGKRFCLIRAKGYKETDQHAIKNGFPEQFHGQSVIAVVQPRQGASPIVQAFDDVETGADFLTFLRSKA